MCYFKSRDTIPPDVKEFLLPVFTHNTAGQFELLGAADIVRGERRTMNEVCGCCLLPRSYVSDLICFGYFQIIMANTFDSLTCE